MQHRRPVGYESQVGYKRVARSLARASCARPAPSGRLQRRDRSRRERGDSGGRRAARYADPAPALPRAAASGSHGPRPAPGVGAARTWPPGARRRGAVRGPGPGRGGRWGRGAARAGARGRAAGRPGPGRAQRAGWPSVRETHLRGTRVEPKGLRVLFLSF